MKCGFCDNWRNCHRRSLIMSSASGPPDIQRHPRKTGRFPALYERRSQSRHIASDAMQCHLSLLGFRHAYGMLPRKDGSCFFGSGKFLNGLGRKAGDRTARIAFRRSIPGLPAWAVKDYSRMPPAIIRCYHPRRKKSPASFETGLLSKKVNSRNHPSKSPWMSSQ